MTHSTDLLTAARAEALFCSSLRTGSLPTRPQVARAVAQAVRLHDGTHGCAAVLAGAYGECPETAVARMRWALERIRTLYPRPSVLLRRGTQGPPRRSLQEEVRS
ncbi:hypothetical protein GCM10010129_00150 [Streptomyces fumigatiscleroticus]|nr:hypothetical protein GCM10010129_00150 [Streptomyces fumigatiscleroticus]